MDKLRMASYDNFYFNGKSIKDLGGFVGSKDGGLKTYPVIPSRQYTVDHAINQDGETVYSSRLEPRVWEVPVFFPDLSEIGLRKVAAWLNSPVPSKFYYEGDDLAIDCVLDSQSFDAETITGIDVGFALKFISHSVYYYQLNPTTKTISPLTSNVKYTCENDSTVEIFPHLTIACSGDIVLKVYDAKDKLLSTSNIKAIVGGVKIDMQNMDCALMSGAPHFANIDVFPTFPETGDFKIEVQGTNLTNMAIKYTKMYI